MDLLRLEDALCFYTGVIEAKIMLYRLATFWGQYVPSSLLTREAVSIPDSLSSQECEQHLNEAQGLFRDAQHWRGEARKISFRSPAVPGSLPRGLS